MITRASLAFRSIRAVAALAAWAALLAPAARGQTIATAAPDPNHEILSAPFQADTDARSQSRLTSGNAFEFLENGVVSFPKKHALIAAARSHVLVEMFQWNDDASGSAYADALIAALGRGVEVRCVVDGTVTNMGVVRRLRSHGARIVRYNPWYMLGGRTGRLHEKSLAVDFSKAIVGGMNNADLYALGDGQNKKYHDTDLYVEGTAAVEVARRFLDVYTSLDPTDAGAAALLAGLPALAQTPPAAAPGRQGYARHLASDPDLGRRYVVDYYVRCFRAAKSQIVFHVNNPEPVEPLLAELKGAGLRGVRVVIVTNSKTAYQAVVGGFFGWWYDWYIQTFYRRRLYSPGIEIWEMDSPIHSKALTIDGVMASVGSFNFGYTSIEKNTEQTLVTYDPATVREVEAMFDRDLAKALRVQ